MELAPTHAIVEVAKVGGSFKLVTLTPKKTVSEMTQLPREIQKNGDTQTNQKSQMYTQNTNLG